MDPASAAGLAVGVLVPAMQKIGDGALEHVGANLTGAALHLWSVLAPRLKERPLAEDAVHEVLHSPGDLDAAASLRLQMKLLLSEEPELLEQLLPHLPGSAAPLTPSSPPSFGGVERIDE